MTNAEKVDVQVWVLEDGPLGSMIAERVDEVVTAQKLPATVMLPFLYQEMLGINTNTSSDEELQARFLSKNNLYVASNVIPVVHVNTETCMTNVDTMLNRGYHVIARLPSPDDAERTLDPNVVKKLLVEKKVPIADYPKIGLNGYARFTVDYITLLGSLA